MSETATASDWRVADDYRAEWPDPEVASGALLDVVSDLFYVADRRGLMRDWNDQFQAVLGYTEEEIADLDPQEFFAEPDRETLADALDRVADGEEVTVTIRLRTKSGTSVPFEFKTTPLTDDDGNVWGLVGIARDISGRVEREHELERYEQLLETVGEGMYVVDEDRTIEWVNDALCDLTGYAREELVGLHLDDDIYGQIVSRDLETELSLRDDDQDVTEIEGTITRKDGDEVPVEVRFSALPDEDSDRTAGLVRDISERKARDRELERYEQLLETVGEGMYVLDENRAIEWVNDQLAAMLGYEREELVGMHVADVVVPDSTDRGAELRQQLLDGEIDVATIEGEMIRKDGSRLPSEGRFSLLDDEPGAVTIGLVRDISDRVERAQLLENIHEASRELMTAETKQDVAETAAEVAYEYTDIATAGVRLLEDEQLRMVAIETEDERLEEVPPPFEVGEGFVGEAYGSGEPVVYDEGVSEQGTSFDYSPVESAMLIPIEGHGMIDLASLEPGAFDEETQELGRLFAADVESALKRADREERLREREQELQEYERLVETVSDGVYMSNEDYEFSMVNEAFVDLLGYDSREELLGKVVPEITVSDQEYEKAVETRQQLIESDQQTVSVENEIRCADGSTRHVETRFSLLPEDDGYRGTAGVVRDVTDRKERAALLKRLHEATRGLQTAETKQDVADRATEVAGRLGFPTIAVREAVDDELVVVAQSTDIDSIEDRELPPFEVGEGLVGQAYEDGEVCVCDDLEATGLKYDPGPIQSAMFVPIPGYGMLSIASPDRGAFGETEQELGRLFAADVESALKRADREERLREREQELQRQQEYTNDLLDAIDDVFYILDEDGYLQRWNDTFSDVTGYSDAEIEEMRGREFFDDEDLEHVTAAMSETLETGSTRIEAAYVTSDGERIPHEFVTSKLQDPDGNTVVVGIGRDITEQKAREQKLRAREQELEQQQKFTNDLLDAIDDVFYILDDEGYLLQWNDSFNRVTGYSNAEIEEMRGRELFPDDDVGLVIEKFYETLDSGQTRVEAEFLTEDGNRIPHEFDTSRLEDPDGSTVVVGIGRDITERKAREQKLKAREQELEQQQTYTNDLLDAVDDVFYILDEDGSLQRWNESLSDVTGYNDEEIDEMHALEFFEPADRGQVRDAIAEGLETGDAKVEAKFSAKGGELVPHEFVASALEDPDGNPVLTGIGRDVTERRKQEDALREREQELQRQRDELETLNRINELIQGTIRSMAAAATREEIETTVCERLAASPFYRFAWTGRRAADDTLIEPWTSAGDDGGYLEAIEVPLQGSDHLGPGALAMQSGDVVVVEDIESDPRFEPWREAALERGFRSVAVVPFRHGKTVHGLLALYADQRAAFSDRERRAFEVLGDMVGFAISAIQHRRLIEAETVLELVIDFPDSETFFAEMASRLHCTCQLLGSVPADDGMLHYVSVGGASAEAVEAYMTETQTERVDACRVVRPTDDGCVVAVQVMDSTPELLQEAGARTVDITATPESIQVVARAARNTDVRMLLDTFRDVQGDPVLEAKREVERDHYTDEAFRTDVASRLTERQDTALSAAYFGGYFDWPRDSTAEDVAESLGISSATLHQHLRHAQHKLLEVYFDDTAARTSS